MDELRFNTPWHKVKNGAGLENKLYKEVGPKHILFGKKVTALARRQDLDEVLFFIPQENRFAIVHLTWGGRPLDERYPSTDFFNSAEAIQKEIDSHIKEWEHDERDFDNSQKRVIIVGATSGIGRKMAELYAQQGYKVGITGRRKELLDEIQKTYPDKIAVECFDVTGNENISKLQSLVQKLGRLDILIYCSGIAEPGKELNWQNDKLTVDTNVYGFIEIANWSFNYFVKQGHGSMAVISSIAANRGNSWAPAYSASKSFQSNYFEALAIKAYRIKKNIGITCIEPGFVDTKMAKGNKRFWIVPTEKAARQMIGAIDKKKRKVYISKRWWLIAKLMRWMPFWIYKRIG